MKGLKGKKGLGREKKYTDLGKQKRSKEQEICSRYRGGTARERSGWEVKKIERRRRTTESGARNRRKRGEEKRTDNKEKQNGRKNGSLAKVGTRLKKSRNSYETIEEMPK